MLLTGKINTITSTGSPDYNICGQATSALSFSNIGLSLSISKSGYSSVTIVSTLDLSTISGLSYSTYTFGDYDIQFTNFSIDNVTSTFQANLLLVYTGTSDKVSWEKFNIFLDVAKTGYQSFRNTFEVYNYDIGNSSGISGIVDTIGNADFEVVLINNTNNLDIYGRQTRVSSNFLTIRKPFTNKVYFYNMIATQGSMYYYDESNNIIGSGNSGFIDNRESIVITQTISINSNNTCSSQRIGLEKQWYPIFSSSFSSEDTCGDCANNVANTTVSYYLDATNTSVFNIGGVPYFLSQFMTSNNVVTTVLNYNSESISTNTHSYTLTYATWISSSSSFLNPVEYTFVPDQVGLNTINIVISYNYNALDISKCTTNYSLNTCNWWTIEVSEACTDYIFTNCSQSSLDLTIQLLDDDKVFQDISVTTVTSLSNLPISFSVDGIYMLKIVQSSSTQYYSLPIFCSLKDCFLNYIRETICIPVKDNCIPESHYNFNSLVINAQTFFLLVSEEMNYNYIYTSISTNKIEELYTMKTFIDRFDNYCKSTGSPCLPCNE